MPISASADIPWEEFRLFDVLGKADRIPQFCVNYLSFHQSMKIAFIGLCYDRSAIIRKHRHIDLIATCDSVKKPTKNVIDFRSNKSKTCYIVKLFISLDIKGF